jgi:two-component system LytT family response regulator
MKRSVVVIEDDPIVAQSIEELIHADARLGHAGSFKNVESALSFVEENEVDLILLDIRLENSNGFEFLRKSGTRAEIIVMSADRSNAAEAYDLEVHQFLTKPFSSETFETAINKAIQTISARGEAALANHIYVKVDHGYRKIQYDRILAVEGQRDYVLFILNDGRCLVRAKMKDVEKALSNHPQFFRCHRSYIVNVSAITFFNSQELHVGDRVIPISAGNYTTLQRLVNVL